MKTNEINFRNVCHKLCYISKGKNFKALVEDMPNAKNASGVLAYGYIDHTAGLTFEILACAKSNKDDRLSVYEGNERASFKYRFGSVSDCEIFIIDDDNLKQRFTDKIEMIDQGYKASEAVCEARKVTIIDECRSQEFPDDVLVILLREGNQPEDCWVRCEGIGKNCLYGVLLNEPNSDFTVHAGDVIEFGVAKTDNGMMCVSVIE